MEMTATPGSAVRSRRGRSLALTGAVLGLLAPLLYVAQLQLKVLNTPWYMPVLGTLGALLLAIALVKARGFWRLVGVIAFGLLAVTQWWLLLFLTKLPAYTGPLAEGRPFPAFSAALADGSTFTDADLKGRQNTALVFFRGRW